MQPIKFETLSSKIQIEMSLFEDGGRRGDYLERENKLLFNDSRLGSLEVACLPRKFKSWQIDLQREKHKQQKDCIAKGIHRDAPDRWLFANLHHNLYEYGSLRVSDAICRFKELDNDDRRLGSGRKRTVNTSKNHKAIEKRIQRNPRVSMRQTARDMGISDRSVRRIAKTELGQKPYKLRKVQLLTEKKTRTALKMPKTFETGCK
ncbi:paired domain-containing protein [Trichonephila clavipes]|nr:paired domain-containing protein [Trichonephila clavipes]